MDINNHISLTSNDDIKKICNKYFKRKKININHVNYFYKFPNGTVCYLCSNHGWLKHYFFNGYMHIGAFETKPYLSNDRYVLWDCLDSDDIILKDSRDLINVDHGLTVVQKDREGIGFFNFGNNDGSISTVNAYLNNLEAINGFIPYFYETAKHAIKDAKTQRILISPAENILKPNQAAHSHASECLVYLSNREMDCVQWYLDGKNSGEIAIILGISRRTVETYIDNIKVKLGCSTLFQIGYCIAAMKYTSYGFVPKL